MKLQNLRDWSLCFLLKTPIRKTERNGHTYRWKTDPFTDKCRVLLNGPDGWSKCLVVFVGNCPESSRHQHCGDGVILFWVGIMLIAGDWWIVGLMTRLPGDFDSSEIRWLFIGAKWRHDSKDNQAVLAKIK